jgi:DNA repair protein RecN (Recombination protein N)
VLWELRLSGLGVIEEAVVPLGAGFTVITGETGAGKTMLLQALGLVTGAKVDASAVRRGSARAVVEARIALLPGGEGAARAIEAGAEAEEDGTYVAVRTLAIEGRTRAALGGRPRGGGRCRRGHPRPARSAAVAAPGSATSGAGPLRRR